MDELRTGRAQTIPMIYYSMKTDETFEQIE